MLPATLVPCPVLSSHATHCAGAALGWVLGTIMVDVAMVAQFQNAPFLEVLGQLDASNIVALLQATSDWMDLLFLAIAVYEGYRFAFRYRLG